MFSQLSFYFRKFIIHQLFLFIRYAVSFHRQFIWFCLGFESAGRTVRSDCYIKPWRDKINVCIVLVVRSFWGLIKLTLAHIFFSEYYTYVRTYNFRCKNKRNRIRTFGICLLIDKIATIECWEFTAEILLSRYWE